MYRYGVQESDSEITIFCLMVENVGVLKFICGIRNLGVHFFRQLGTLVCGSLDLVTYLIGV